MDPGERRSITAEAPEVRARVRMVRSFSLNCPARPVGVASDWVAWAGRSGWGVEAWSVCGAATVASVGEVGVDGAGRGVGVGGVRGGGGGLP